MTLRTEVNEHFWENGGQRHLFPFGHFGRLIHFAHVALVFVFSHPHLVQLKKEQHPAVGREPTLQSDVPELEFLLTHCLEAVGPRTNHFTFPIHTLAIGPVRMMSCPHLPLKLPIRTAVNSSMHALTSSYLNLFQQYTEVSLNP